MSNTSLGPVNQQFDFDNIINFRDVGKFVNRLCGSQILEEGVLFRSARMKLQKETDNAYQMSYILLVSLIFDLGNQLFISNCNAQVAVRNFKSDTKSAIPSTEHRMAAKKRMTEKSRIDVLKDAVDDVDPNVHLVQIPGARRFLISLIGKDFERALLWRLGWWDVIKAAAWSASGYRDSAAKLVVREAMQPRGLIGLSRDKLDHSGYEMKDTFDVLADCNNYPVVIHCTQGKDRTGLIVLLLLLLTGVVPEEAMSADYVKSEPELRVELQERLEEMHELGLSDDFAKCPAGYVADMKKYIDSKYGGVEAYLLSIGINLKKQETIRKKLIA
ncbi:hypothetical protein MPDQ_001635 [Monascus purpureus]|uniref:Tyrosine specific protein phosphatases domain-containing protein n=1 Tax=Monascus purpureus TaxID=5098 RepID=A0A507QRI3_MONPU|nr:hypothetical protein MPDQ_001635 [Monascus purpureus]